jgi:hypothetical protein
MGGAGFARGRYMPVNRQAIFQSDPSAIASKTRGILELAIHDHSDQQKGTSMTSTIKTRSIETIGLSRLKELFSLLPHGKLIRNHTGDTPAYKRIGKRLYVRIDKAYVPAAQIAYALQYDEIPPRGTMLYFKDNNPNNLDPRNFRVVIPDRSSLALEFQEHL